ncbi:MAG: FtsX-like permease family protein [Acidobacteriota bacterium]|nr:FtsX-like permease family protein [Acidobacteriota bacterium]
MLVFSAFGAVALALAAVGLFASVAYDVNQGAREIAVRIALGAAPGDIVRLMVAQGAGPAAAGLVIGVPAALGTARLLSGILFGITPTDPATFAEVVALLVVVVALASYLPARRAAWVDPQVVLREG